MQLFRRVASSLPGMDQLEPKQKDSILFSSSSNVPSFRAILANWIINVEFFIDYDVCIFIIKVPILVHQGLAQMDRLIT